MGAKIGFDGATVYASQDDPIDLGLQVRSGHSGFHGLKYDVGAERQVCSNGMTAFISELGFDQTHGEPFQPGLAYNAVDAVVESPAEIEQRLAQAQNRLLNAMHAEVDDPESPTLWETYNAGTRALTHYTQDVPDYELADGLDQASQILENGVNEVPEPDSLGRSAVHSRSRALIEGDGVDPYWPDEEDALRDLMREHEIEV
jgi:hypothetical protein